MYNDPVKRFIPQLILFAVVPISFSFLPGIKSDTSAIQGVQVNKIYLFRAFPFEVKPKSVVSLEGSGFSRTLNKIYFNGKDATTAVSTTGTSLKVTLPSKLTPGEYRVSVVNSFGSSENPEIPVIVRVTDTPIAPPVIQGASISGDIVTVTGQGFGSSSTVFTSFGNTPGPVPAQDSTLSFRLSELSQFERVKNTLPEGSFQAILWIYVESEHGANKTPYRLDIRLQ